MIVTFNGEKFTCDRAVRSGNSATLHLSSGGTVEFTGVSDFEQFQLSGGDWEIPEPTVLEQLRADLDYISVMTGVTL